MQPYGVVMHGITPIHKEYEHVLLFCTIFVVVVVNIVEILSITRWKTF